MYRLLKSIFFAFVMLLLWNGHALAAVPAAPSNLTAETYSDSRIDLTWDDNSSDETNFFIYRRTVNSNTYSLVTSVNANTESYRDTSLDEDTRYYYMVCAFNSSGSSAYSNVVSATTDEDDDDDDDYLAAPDNLEADVYSSTRIDLTWDDNSSGETKFYIYRKTGSSGTYTRIGSVDEDEEEYRDRDVEPDTKYYYRIRAYDDEDYSDYSNVVSATTDEDDDDDEDDDSYGYLDAPDNLEADVYSDTRIDLTWDDNSSGETKFYIYRRTGSSGDYTRIGSADEDEEDYRDTDLDPDTKYYYRIRAYDGEDYSDYSNVVSATTDDEDDDDSNGSLDAPDNLEAEAYSNSRIDLTWDDNSSDETRFYIYRRTGTIGSYSQIASVGEDVEEYRDTSLEPGTRYYYRIRAYDGDDYSDYSEEVYAVTTGSSTDKPDDPTNLTVSYSNGAMKLVWTDNATNEATYIVERKTGSGSYVELSWLAPNVTTYNDTSATDTGTAYTYRVRAYNANGYSGYSNTASTQSQSSTGNDLRFTQGSRTYYYKGQQYNMDAAPINLNDRIMIPIRYVTDHLGAGITWNDAAKKVTITYKTTTIELWVNNRTAKVNSVNKSIDADNSKVVPVIVPPGRTMVPIRFVSENLGCKVSWDNDTKTAIITLP